MGAMTTKSVVKARKRRAWTTSVFVKQMMALSGLFFVLFLLFHAYGNLKMFLGAEAYNGYAEWLKTDAFYPIFPHGGFIWVFRVIMVVLILVHVASAGHVWIQSRKGRKQGYAVKKNAADAYAARTMRWGGVCLLLLIIFHLLHFTTGTITTGFTTADTPYERMVAAFQIPWVLVVYVVFIAIATSHVGHGFWSAFQTMGWVRKDTRKFMVCLSGVIAAIMFLMFLLPPFFIAFGVIS